MAIVRLDPPLDDDARRRAMFAGEVWVHRARPASLALVELANAMLCEAFAPLDPRDAQHSLPVERFAAILAELKPRFIHEPRCKSLIPQLLRELGCDPSRTYFDVPRLRSATSDGYLTTGIAYAFHPHRDTWYSAPLCQINWWIPLHVLDPGSGMAFHPRYFERPIANTSNEYNYQDWNQRSRFAASMQIGVDTRRQPRATESLFDEPPLEVLPESGGVMTFSAAQLHSTQPNRSRRTRFSIDFRTVHADDVRSFAGSRNLDSRCTGTTMGDYLRCTDLTHVPREIAAAYDQGPPQPCEIADAPKPSTEQRVYQQ